MRLLIVASLMWAVAVVAGSAAVPASITVQGVLTDSLGSPLPPGVRAFTFRIYDAAANGNEIWPGETGEIQSIASDANGRWVALVGALSPLSDTVFADSTRWLDVTVDGVVLPRVRLTTGAYAYRVASIDGARGGTVRGWVGIEQVNPTSMLSVNGSFATRVRQTATSTTLDAQDQFLIVTAGGITITLPPAATCPGRHYYIKSRVPGTGYQIPIVVSPGSGDTIDGASVLNLIGVNHSWTLVSDGTSTWLIVD
ncbi:MAG TPA: hypothetical protein VNN55_01075 [bacterium]|nr:hypothetical protein [bacterium]